VRIAQQALDRLRRLRPVQPPVLAWLLNSCRRFAPGGARLAALALGSARLELDQDVPST